MILLSDSINILELPSSEDFKRKKKHMKVGFKKKKAFEDQGKKSYSRAECLYMRVVYSCT